MNCPECGQLVVGEYNMHLTTCSHGGWADIEAAIRAHRTTPDRFAKFRAPIGRLGLILFCGGLTGLIVEWLGPSPVLIATVGLLAGEAAANWLERQP